MKRNQIIVVAACAVLCIGIYLFASTKKPKTADEAPVVTDQGQGHQQQADALDIEAYIADVNAKITDKATKERIDSLKQAKSYKGLAGVYQKLDKPLAVAYYAVKLATMENTAQSYAYAGDYSAMLIQTAPDDKARNYLGDNMLQCYQKSVALDSTNTENRIRLAGAYMEGGGQPMQGVAILLDIVRKDSNNVDAQLMLGRFGLISGQFDKAIVRLEKILYLQPQNSEAMLLLAEAYDGKGNKKKALELLEKCKKTVDNPEAKKEIDGYIQKLKKPNGSNS